MKTPDPALLLHAGPHLSTTLSTPRLMRHVLYALVPVLGAGVWFFGLGALFVVAAATAGAALTEGLFTSPRGHTLKDGSAILTGVLLGLTLPPALPLWIAFVGGVVAVGLGKLVWGGLGHNLFNPALVGRAFLQAAFPSALTTWTPARAAGDSFATRVPTFAPPLMHGGVDAVTTATPLARYKFDALDTPLMELLAGNTAGSIGETSALLLLLVGVYLTLRRVFDWRIPVGVLGAVAVGSGLLHVFAPDAHPAPLAMLLSGGLLFGTVFMATDPVTSPLAPRATWIFAIGIGLLVVLIRRFGGLPEGVMYAILLMNAAAPHLDRLEQPRAFGHDRRTA